MINSYLSYVFLVLAGQNSYSSRLISTSSPDEKRTLNLKIAKANEKVKDLYMIFAMHGQIVNNVKFVQYTVLQGGRTKSIATLYWALCFSHS